jgi:hypothetical protein
MHGPSAAAMSLRACANRLRRVSYTYNLTGVLNSNVLALCAACGVVTNVRSHTRAMW